MNVTVCRVNMAELAAELRAVPLRHIRDGSGSSHFNGPEGWIKGLSLTRIQLGETYPLAKRAIEDLQERTSLGKLTQIMVNNLEPGGQLSPHRDGPPNYHRWHLPIVTHELAYWWDELEGRRHMVKGWWYGPVPYCGILHMAGNPSPVNRLHLVADFEM